ncbi:MAG: SLATT domain-containing protein [bacterium]|nr:SLATT domain-containing protein [bacterium]
MQERLARCFKWINLVVLTIGSSGLISSLFINQNLLLLIGSFFTLMGLGLGIFQMSFNPEEKAYKYKQTAHQLWQVREKYTCFIADMMREKVSPDEIQRKRDQFICDLDLIYKNALPTTSEAYKLASTALQKNEEFTFSDDEINKFLPKDLWLNQK